MSESQRESGMVILVLCEKSSNLAKPFIVKILTPYYPFKMGKSKML